MSPARPIPAAPGFLTSGLRVFDLSVGEMLWSRRTIFMVLVVGAPVLIALFLRAARRARRAGASAVGPAAGIRMTGPAIFGLMIWVFYLRFTVPVLGVFYGTSLIADEVEDKTITYLFTRPIRRGAVLVGKYLAYLACTIFVVLPSVDARLPADRADAGAASAARSSTCVKDLALLALGLAVYGARVRLHRRQVQAAAAVGLIFIFGWEQAALAFPGYLKKFTVAYYLQALVPHAMPNDSVVSLIQGIFRETPSLWDEPVLACG